jgi:hypothetical protein
MEKQTLSLYIAAIISSFLFAFLESFIGLFNFKLTAFEVSVIIILTVAGMWVSLALDEIIVKIWKMKKN